MHPKCPKCRNLDLEPAAGALARVSSNERALTCAQCHGYFLPRQVVEHWQTEPFVELSEDETLPIDPEADHKTGLCPMGHGILLRARVEPEEDHVFHLERCGFCHRIWLDRGEWQRLATAFYLDHLNDLWDPLWQKRHRNEKLQRRLDRSLFDQLGENLYQDLSSVVERLRRHPSKAQALAWIRQHLDPHAQAHEGLTTPVRSEKTGE